MKKLRYLCLTIILVLSLLCSCAPPEEPQDPEQPEQPISEPYKFERDKITEIAIHGQIPNVYHLSDDENESLLDLIESLEPRVTSEENDEYGWLYFIDVIHEDGSKVVVTIAPRYITIDGYICDADGYSTELFIDFFPFPSN